MFFAIFIGLLVVFVAAISVLAIVMSTSHGSAWVEALWNRRNPRSPDPTRNRDRIS